MRWNLRRVRKGAESVKERKWNPIFCCFISTFHFLLFWHGKRQRKQRCLDWASVCRLTCHKGLMLDLQRQLETPGGPLEGSHWRLSPLPWSLIKGGCLSYNVGVCLCECVCFQAIGGMFRQKAGCILCWSVPWGLQRNLGKNITLKTTLGTLGLNTLIRHSFQWCW